MLRRLARKEDGLAIPVAMAILVVILIISAAAVSLGLNNLDRARKDRSYSRALAAADSGVDVATQRVNRLLVLANGANLLPSVNQDLVKSVGCVLPNSIGKLEVSALVGGATWCTTSSWEKLETSSDPTRKQEFSYSVSLGALQPGGLVQRRVVATGRVGTTKRRVLAILNFDPSENNATSLFRRQRFVECPVEPTGPSPDSGCPG